MTSEKAFQLYFAVKLYFSSEYDVFTRGTNFNGRNKVSSRKDFPLISAIMKNAINERQLIEFCVANHLYGNPNMLYDSDHALELYKHWNKVKQSLTYSLERDLDYIYETGYSLDDYMKKHVVSDLLSSKIEYESVILLDHKSDCISKIEGFDASKYITRMKKASKFVGKGVLGKSQSSHIDIFLKSMKGKENGNIAI